MVWSKWTEGVLHPLGLKPAFLFAGMYASVDIAAGLVYATNVPLFHCVRCAILEGEGQYLLDHNNCLSHLFCSNCCAPVAPWWLRAPLKATPQGVTCCCWGGGHWGWRSCSCCWGSWCCSSCGGRLSGRPWVLAGWGLGLSDWFLWVGGGARLGRSAVLGSPPATSVCGGS